MMVQYCCDSGTTNKLFLQVLLTFMGSQLSNLKCVVMIVNLGIHKITQAAHLCIRCKQDVIS